MSCSECAALRQRVEAIRVERDGLLDAADQVVRLEDDCFALRQQVEELERALSFYADTRRYQGSNQPYRDGDDPFTPARSPYLIDAHRDGGAIARAALAAAKGGE